MYLLGYFLLPEPGILFLKVSCSMLIRLVSHTYATSADPYQVCLKMSSTRGRGAALLQALRKRQEDERKKRQEEEEGVSSTPTVTDEDSSIEATRVSLESSFFNPPPSTSTETDSSAITPPTSSKDSVDVSSKSTESIAKAPPSFRAKEPTTYHGTAGREIKLACNYLLMDVEEGKGIFEYGVSFSPSVDSGPERFKLLNQHRETFGASKVFDGARLLIPFKMEQDKTILTSSLQEGDEVVKIEISFREMKDLQDPECLQLFNSVFKRLFKKLNLAQMKSGVNLRSYFDPSHRQVDIGNMIFDSCICICFNFSLFI